MTGQISQLQNICHNMPYGIWQTTDEDTLIWQNKAYNSLNDSFETKVGHGLFDLILSYLRNKPRLKIDRVFI